MAERRHRQRIVRRQMSRTADNDLRDVRSARIVYRGASGLSITERRVLTWFIVESSVQKSLARAYADASPPICTAESERLCLYAAWHRLEWRAERRSRR